MNIDFLNKINFNFSRSNIWEGILVFFMTLIFFVFLFNIYLYLQIDKNNIFTIDNITKTKKESVGVNKIYLSEIIQEFDNKSEELERLKENKPYNVDPSL